MSVKQTQTDNVHYINFQKLSSTATFISMSITPPNIPISSHTTTPMAITSILLLFLCFIISSQQSTLSALELQVGGPDGWIIPPENNTNYYTQWASKNRFRIDDIINFKYKKDSVLEVRKTDYKTCNSTHPLFFSNTGNTMYKLRSKRTYYFISGVAGHCDMGQKVIIKVLAADEEEGGSEMSGAGTVAGFLGWCKLLVVSLVAASASYLA